VAEVIKQIISQIKRGKKVKLHYAKNTILNNGIKKVGNYEIEEIIEDKYGNIAKSTRNIEVVNKPPISSFTTSKYVYRAGERIKINSEAYDPENELKKVVYFLKNRNRGSLNYYIKNGTRIKTVGSYILFQYVTDKYGNRASTNKYIRIESTIRSKIKKDYSENNIKSILGKPYARLRNGKFTWSDYELKYDNYWFIMDDNELKCVVYDYTHRENDNCSDYRRHGVILSPF